MPDRQRARSTAGEKGARAAARVRMNAFLLSNIHHEDIEGCFRTLLTLRCPIRPKETVYGHVLESAKKGEWNAVYFPGESDWATCHPLK